MTQTHFLGTLVPRLTYEVERGTCLGKVKRYGGYVEVQGTTRTRYLTFFYTQSDPILF